jgi:hypothetical protein
MCDPVYHVLCSMVGLAVVMSLIGGALASVTGPNVKVRHACSVNVSPHCVLAAHALAVDEQQVVDYSTALNCSVCGGAALLHLISKARSHAAVVPTELVASPPPSLPWLWCRLCC